MPVLQDYRGIAIRLTDERLEHILEHPEMRGLKLVIEEALNSPEAVVESASDPHVHLYYRTYNHPRLGEKYVCVVVKAPQ